MNRKKFASALDNQSKQGDKPKSKVHNAQPVRRGPPAKDLEKKKTTCFISSEADVENVFKKLRELHAKVSKGQTINVADLKRALDYAIGVANRTHFIHQNTIEHPADSVFECESVPYQVRDWLTMTFTRSQTLTKDEIYEGIRFKSIANAIRAGISVDRIMKMTLPKNEVSEVIMSQLSKINDWTFSIFELNDATVKSHGLRHVARTIFNNYDIPNKFKIPRNNLELFIIMLEEGYRKHKNPYHNDLHAADVAQTVSCFLTQSDLKSYLTDLELFSVLFAALVHDFEHTGTTNTFHINTRSDLALLYNDRAVLENHHLSQTFRRLMQDTSTNITEGLSQAEFNEFRYSVIDIVLATDMSFHFQQLKLLKSASTPPDVSLTMLQMLCAIVHFADISHPSKAWKTHQEWTKRLFDEFFIQGDREAELRLPISPLCDRHNTMRAESQIGFIDYIISPTVSQIFEAIPLAMTMRLEEMGGNLQKHSDESIEAIREEIEHSMKQNKANWMEESKKS